MVPIRRPKDRWSAGAPALGPSQIRSTRTNARRCVAVVRELVGDTHPIDAASSVAAATEGAIGGFAVRPMRLMSDSVLHFSDIRVAASQEMVMAETDLGCRSSVARWTMIASQTHSRFRDPHAIRLTH